MIDVRKFDCTCV